MVKVIELLMLNLLGYQNVFSLFRHVLRGYLCLANKEVAFEYS